MPSRHWEDRKKTVQLRLREARESEEGGEVRGRIGDTQSLVGIWVGVRELGGQRGMSGQTSRVTFLEDLQVFRFT